MLALFHWCEKCQRCRWWRLFILFSGGSVATCRCGKTGDISSINMAVDVVAWQSAGEMPSYTGLSLFIAGPPFV